MCTGNCLHSIYTVLGIVSTVEMIWHMNVYVCSLYANTPPFYITDQSILELWYLQDWGGRSWNQSSKDTKGWLYSLPLPHQFNSVAQSCPILCDPMDCSTPGLPVHHQPPEPTQTHVHRVGDAIQPSHPLSSPSPPAFNLSQHQGLFQWVNSSHQVAKVLEFQLQHQSFQWIFRTDFL